MRRGAVQFIRFQTELGVMSGPGADYGEERANALATSEARRGGVTLQVRREVAEA